jgi:hypothetical protein
MWSDVRADTVPCRASACEIGILRATSNLAEFRAHGMKKALKGLAGRSGGPADADMARPANCC